MKIKSILILSILLLSSEFVASNSSGGDESGSIADPNLLKRQRSSSRGSNWFRDGGG
ncbi:7441_t:CDS:1, partial [Acaulospora colombiana]